MMKKMLATISYNIMFWLIYMIFSFEGLFFFHAAFYALLLPVIFYLIYNKIFDSDDNLCHVVQGVITVVFNACGFLIYYGILYEPQFQRIRFGFKVYEGGQVTIMTFFLTTAEFILITIFNYFCRNKKRKDEILFLTPIITLLIFPAIACAINLFI